MKSWNILSKKEAMIKRGWEKCGLGDHLWEKDFQVIARREVILRKLLKNVHEEELEQPSTYYDEPVADVTGEEAMEICLTNPDKLNKDDDIFEIENKTEEEDNGDFEDINNDQVIFFFHEIILMFFTR